MGSAPARLNVTRGLVIVQVGALALQSSIHLVNLLPERWHPWFHFALSFLQLLGGLAQRSYNSSGVHEKEAQRQAVAEAMRLIQSHRG